jgi:hypothetical protein
MNADLLALLHAVEAAGAKVWNRNHGMKCPKCQHLRRRHKKARPLSVKRTADGILYHCWHCGWKGFHRSGDAAADGWRRSRQQPVPRLPVWF